MTSVSSCLSRYVVVQILTGNQGFKFRVNESVYIKNTTTQSLRGPYLISETHDGPKYTLEDVKGDLAAGGKKFDEHELEHAGLDFHEHKLEINKQESETTDHESERIRKGELQIVESGLTPAVEELDFDETEPHLKDHISPNTLRDDVIDSLGDMSSQKQPPMSDDIDQTQDRSATTSDTSIPGNSSGRIPAGNIAHVDSQDMYSTASVREDTEKDLIERFTRRLVADLTSTAILERVASIPLPELEALLKAFAGRLHEESTAPFGWKASVDLCRESG